MKNFEKSKKLENVCYDIRGVVMDEATKMQDEGIEILKLNIGNPAVFNFKAPHKIINCAKENLCNAEGYSESKGIIDAREAIVEYCKSKGIRNVTPNDIYIGNGVSELIVMSMQGLLNNRDEILVPMPDYPLWTAAVNLAGGNAIHYRCSEKENWYPDINDIKKKITNNTKGIVIINPNNPTGALYPKEILENILKIAKENGLIIFADEIYDRLVLDNLKHISIASLDSEAFVVTFNGLSKSHMVAGFRTGWMCLSGNKKNVKGYIEGLNLLSSMRLCSNVPSQYIITEALKDMESTKKLLLPGGRVYEQRDFIYKELNSIPGITAVKPQAAFYIFPKIDTKKFNIKDDEKFVLDLLKEKRILLVHGGGFNWDKPDHFRIVYLPEISTLKCAMTNFRAFLENYHQE